jgi:hypothetical protein
MKFVPALALCALALGYTQPVAAFSDYELFSLPPLEGGGGGGRYFTGSTSDGYGCAVCHLRGVTPIVQMRGLPEQEYTPGANYDVEIVWLFPQVPHALNLEFVTPQGVAGGTIALPDPGSLGPEDRCDAAHASMPAAQIIPESAPRQVLSLNACGAQRLRFRFTAPADTQVMFAASIVRSDNSEKPEGDGVIELRRVLYRQGFAVSKAASCSVPLGSSAGAGMFASLLAALALTLALRRRRLFRPRASTLARLDILLARGPARFDHR